MQLTIMGKVILEKNDFKNYQQQLLTVITVYLLTHIAHWTHKSWFTCRTGSLHDITVTVLTVLRTLQRTVLPVVSQ